jgi:hypothetical protein
VKSEIFSRGPKLALSLRIMALAETIGRPFCSLQMIKMYGSVFLVEVTLLLSIRYMASASYTLADWI